MTAPAQNNADAPRHHVFAWLLFPLALFPLLALLTYDSRVFTETPAPVSSNWIGALGDTFAHWGYLAVGLAIWVVPVIVALCAFAAICGRRLRTTRRLFWVVVFLVALASLVHVLGTHESSVIAALTRRINIANAGGFVGHLVMTRALEPLLSPFGSSMLMLCLALFALVGIVGAHNCAAALARFFAWAAGSAARRDDDRGDSRGGDIPATALDDAASAARAAKEEARRQREEEKARIREEKLREKEAKRAAKEARKAGEKKADEPAVDAADAAAGGDERSPYILPPLSLLNPLKKSKADHGDVQDLARRIVDTLKLFNVDSTLEYTIEGPVVTKFAIRLAPGTRYSSVTNLAKNLMGSLHAMSLRIEAPIPGEEFVGIEVPNRVSAGISFREIIESEAWRQAKAELPLLFGKNAAGKELVADLASMPHLLVAGATGQGKSVCLNAIINGLLMTKTPEELKLIMVDPKSVEFTAYASLPHLIVPVITENKRVVFSLQWAVQEMERRLKLFARARARNIYDFNHRPNLTQPDLFGGETAASPSDMPRTVPYIVIIIDEVADLMASNGKQVTPDIARLTAKARAAGIHLILATQRPDAKIITGTIKANIPGRVAFKTSQAIDSRTILDESGAENLIGRGDMLFKGKDGLLVRAQGAWISDEEIGRITAFIEEHSKTEFDERFTKKLATIKEEEADLFAEEGDASSDAKEEVSAREQVKAEEKASDFKKAVECVINTNRASISHFQRRLGWGYNHSAKILDMLEDAGIVGPQGGAGPRQIIMDQEQLLEIFRSTSPDGDDGGHDGTTEEEQAT